MGLNATGSVGQTRPMGFLMWVAIIVVEVVLVIALVVGGANWFISEHDKRAEKYKRELEICRKADNG